MDWAVERRSEGVPFRKMEKSMSWWKSLVGVGFYIDLERVGGLAYGDFEVIAVNCGGSGHDDCVSVVQVVWKEKRESLEKQSREVLVC